MKFHISLLRTRILTLYIEYLNYITMIHDQIALKCKVLSSPPYLSETKQPKEKKKAKLGTKRSWTI